MGVRVGPNPIVFLEEETTLDTEAGEESHGYSWLQTPNCSSLLSSNKLIFAGEIGKKKKSRHMKSKAEIGIMYPQAKKQQ